MGHTSVRHDCDGQVVVEHSGVIWTGLYSARNITYHSTTSSCCDCQVKMGH